MRKLRHPEWNGAKIAGMIVKNVATIDSKIGRTAVMTGVQVATSQPPLAARPAHLPAPIPAPRLVSSGH